MDQRLSEQYHRGNTKTSEIHWETSEIHNFSRGDSNYQHTPGRQKTQTLFTGTDFVGLIFTGELSGMDSAGVYKEKK